MVKPAYKIDHNVPVPTVQTKSNSFPFAEMEAGDSFVFSGDRNVIQSASSIWGKRHGQKYTVRKIDDTRFRVFRVE